ncbi:phage baseplate assembly protein V [Citrobacter portucalensis]|uniref:phage baseplate assembly protein V n=1 Tax=Citrobacter portucalensis TaxID=1639133 RepID=UPI00226B980E|nr:phage baseplate assembly protein V [Citrobacter portucalensis]MCX9038823.1 phage baseplate assembly protein V [Citrobacter portucalensis]
MNAKNETAELLRRLNNMIRTGVITEVDTGKGLCRVQTGDLETTWLNWLTPRAGRSRVWWAPSVDEQVLLLCIGGDLTTAFVLPGIFCDVSPAPSTSADALHITFPDGAVIEYEPETGTLTASGIKTADVTASVSATITVPQVTVSASQSITLDTPEVVCTHKLTTGTLELKNGGSMKGDIIHSGGGLKSNGIQVDSHKHSGVKSGGDESGGPV